MCLFSATVKERERDEVIDKYAVELKGCLIEKRVILLPTSKGGSFNRHKYIYYSCSR